MKRIFPKASVVLLIALVLRFSALSSDFSSLQDGWEGGAASIKWYNQYYTPLLSNGLIGNLSTALMNGIGVGPLIGPSFGSLIPDTLSNHRGSSKSSKSTTRHRRILLGISTKDYLDKAERQHRRIIRDTWLQPHFHRNNAGDDDEESSASSDRVCSLHQLLLKPIAKDDVETCQLVYTFLFPNTDKNQTTNLEQLLDVYRQHRDCSDKVDEDLDGIQEAKHDAFFVSFDNPTNQYNVLLRWARLVVQISRKRSIPLGSFDYVGFATTQAMVFPQHFWKENNGIFQSMLPHESMVAGIPNDKYDDDDDAPKGDDFVMKCSQSFCLDPNFLCFSQDIVKYLATSRALDVLDTKNQDGLPMEASSLASSNLFHSFQEYKQSTGSGISWKTLSGVKRASKVPEKVISAWDNYIATITDFRQLTATMTQDEEYSHAPVISYQGYPRMLVGIFTTNLKPIERKRRNALRQTFIKSYDHTPTPHRICSLQEVLNKQVSEEECQLAYTFVIGAGKRNEAPTVNVNANSTEEMVIPSIEIVEPEPDVLYLSIQENMNNGKSETWFKYATLLSENQLYFDYITKMDTDTLLLPYPLFEKMSQWPKYPKNVHVYGGHYVVKQDAVQRAVPVLGTSYMDGPMYWLSPDVARFISDPKRCNHTELRTHAEDMSIGNYVNSFPHPIRRLTLSNKCYVHPLKSLEHYRKRWKRYKKKFGKYHP